MEYRKLIQFGGNSFVVSLPKKWIIQNDLKKGDLIYVDFDNKNLLLSPEKENAELEKIELIINTDSKTKFSTIRRKIFSAYVGGATDIIITGQNLNEYSEKINEWLKKYIALEVIEQTSTKIIAKSYVDIETVDIISFVRRIDNTIRSMMIDFKECFKKDFDDKKEIIRTIFEREENIDKIGRLLYRVIQTKLLHPNLSKVKNPIELLRYWESVKILSKMSNEIEYIAKISKNEILKSKRKNKEDGCIENIGELKEVQTQLMNAFYKKDSNLADETAYKINEIIKEIEENCADCDRDKKRIILNILNFMRDLNRLSI